MFIDKILNNNTNNIAYIVNNEEISYKELIKTAKKYALLLEKQGKGPVIVYGNKNIDMIISFIACLIAKRTYIPIDIFTPLERIKDIIKITNCDLIITTNNLNLNLDNINCVTLKDLNVFNKDLKNDIDNDIAYIIFTSGSTGIPKGVPISYDNLNNFVSWISNLNYFKDYKRVNILNQASFSFDLSIADTYYSLCNNHTLISLDYEHQENYQDMFNYIKSKKINLMFITPTFIKLCLTNPDFNEKNFNSIKLIYFCGERLEKQEVNNLFERFPNIKIINAYGPTEATSAISAIEITKDMLEKEEILPVGDMNFLATDVFIDNSEILLKGKSVFKGYLNSKSTINCYHTKDIGFVKDNKLYCKGRMDNQIKYKGYRIELDDIEINIKKIHHVKDAVVIAKYDSNNKIKYISSLIVVDNKKYDEFYVKKQLKIYLPPYMVPKKIVIVNNLPINNNGKIDRKKIYDLC